MEEGLDTAASFMDELLNFSSDVGEQDDEDDDKAKPPPSSSSLSKPGPDGYALSFHDAVEEELEWLSNKDAFPEVDTFVGILSVDPGIVPKLRSPMSVLEGCNSNSCSSSSSNNSGTIMSCCGGLRVPGRARSKRRRRRRRTFANLPSQQWWWYCQAINKSPKFETPAQSAAVIGRKCQHCKAEKTPQWRAGPLGPKTLCNACGVRYKSGRLVPEYRPASSPTFSDELHSNSHRKIIEMRRLKQRDMVVKPVEIG